ncbi:MAG: LysE family translocator [Chloroflexota bacterium]|nr:LysE family translocator [Chloroflexota bacterium]
MDNALSQQHPNGGKQWETFFRYLVSGLLIGVSVAAPVGAMGLLTIRRTLAHGWRAGFITGLGIASADGIYGAFAAFGLTLLTNLLIGIRPAIGLIGGLFLIYLGVKSILQAQPPPSAPDAEVEPDPRGTASQGGAVNMYLSALALTLTNPTTILAFIGIFAGAGLSVGRADGANDTLSAVFMLVGVISGSIAWWLTLTTGVTLVRRRLTPGILVWIGRVSGLMLVAFGLSALVNLFAP